MSGCALLQILSYHLNSKLAQIIANLGAAPSFEVRKRDNTCALVRIQLSSVHRSALQQTDSVQ